VAATDSMVSRAVRPSGMRGTAEKSRLIS
jgi:hypothetical protein